MCLYNGNVPSGTLHYMHFITPLKADYGTNVGIFLRP
jgi:hypothetical protein